MRASSSKAGLSVAAIAGPWNCVIDRDICLLKASRIVVASPIAWPETHFHLSVQETESLYTSLLNLHMYISYINLMLKTWTNFAPRPPAQTLSRSRGERRYLAAVEKDFSPRLRDKVWAGGLGTRLYWTESGSFEYVVGSQLVCACILTYLHTYHRVRYDPEKNGGPIKRVQNLMFRTLPWM